MTTSESWMTAVPYKKQLRITHRAPRVGPELSMLRAAEKQLPNDPVVLREPALPTGNPDLVLAYPRRASQELSARWKLKVEHLRLLQALMQIGPSTVDDLAGLTNRPRRAVERLLRGLVESGFVIDADGVFQARAACTTFGAQRIVAIEGKMRDWRRAIRQAAANLWFASESYVLLPTERLGQLAKQEAAELGIGILVFADGRLRIVSRARRTPLPVSYGSWVLGEIALRKRVTRAKRRNRRISGADGPDAGTRARRAKRRVQSKARK